MQVSNYSAELTITGCGLCPGENERLALERCGSGYRITCRAESNGEHTDSFFDASAEDVDHQFELLRKAVVCAYPVSTMVLDGEYVELTVHGEQADLTMGWWTAPPYGADALFKFSEWMHKLVFPDRDISFEACDDDRTGRPCQPQVVGQRD